MMWENGGSDTFLDKRNYRHRNVPDRLRRFSWKSGINSFNVVLAWRSDTVGRKYKMRLVYLGLARGYSLTGVDWCQCLLGGSKCVWMEVDV